MCIRDRSGTPYQHRTPGTPGRTPQKPHVRFSPPGNPVLANMTPHEAVQFALSATEAELSAAGFQRGGGGGRGGGGNADAVKYQGPYSSSNPPPSMSPDWKAWCLKNRACFRCRKPNAGHVSSQCEAFPDVHAVEGAEDLIDLSAPLNG